MGKGASGYGITLVVELERIGTDSASLIAIGTALWQAIRWIGRRRSRPSPSHASPVALGALAAASAPEVERLVIGCEFAGCRVFYGSDIAGTDDRDVWVTQFVNTAEGTVVAIFTTPSARLLGHCLIPLAVYYDGMTWHFRNDGELPER